MEGYNGYKNYETWNCNLWFMNDEPSYTYWKEAAATAIKNRKDKNAAAAVLMDQMKEAVENDLADFLKIQKNGGGIMCRNVQ